ncbi:hypothetical protein [uncultured Cohaesibacter sp.]|uniref:hypothetical protein n=1 Tax=uncultured Cohaesibacter sp. TaxID=1002546 RepID=UPI00292F28A9|nr:hypothetical protein [uncultured Cohaesibacter sp.]
MFQTPRTDMDGRDEGFGFLEMINLPHGFHPLRQVSLERTPTALLALLAQRYSKGKSVPFNAPLTSVERRQRRDIPAMAPVPIIWSVPG